MSNAKLVNIARLMTTYNFEIKQLPDNLKCAQCKLVLSDACKLPCCCIYCRVCIDDMMARGGKFCPGSLEKCAESALSRFVSDYASNKGVSRLTVKCSREGCVHECPLVKIEEHLRVCQRKNEECPFREFGCTQDKFVAEEMGKHLQRENPRHSELFIRIIANINMEIEMLKQKDEANSKEIETLKRRDEANSKEIKTLKRRDEANSKEIETLKWRDEANSKEIETLKRRDEANSKEIETLKRRDEANSKEIETLKRKDEANSKEIETLKRRDEANSGEIETLKYELALKDVQLRSTMDHITHVQNENKSIKEEKEDLVSRLKILTETIEREIAERHGNDELDSAREIDHVGGVMTAMTRLIASNKNELVTEMQSVRGYIGSINEGVELIKDEICSVKSQTKSVQALMGLGKFDASYVWLININVGSKTWEWGQNLSGFFTGAVHPYKYRLTSSNNHIGTTRSALRIQLCIYANPNDGELAWPFKARVVITVADRDKREACKSNSLQCRTEKPPDNSCSCSDYFVFPHSQLRGAGLNLSKGVRVSCVIVLRCRSVTS